MKATATREKAEVELLKLHPDFGEIRDSDDFHEWAEEQPKWVQEALYENDADARSAARAIDLYKADKNIKPKKSASSKDAARSVETRNERSKPQSDPMGNAIKESDVQKCLQSNTKETLTRLWKLFVQATLYTIYLGQLDKSIDIIVIYDITICIIV